MKEKLGNLRPLLLIIYGREKGPKIDPAFSLLFYIYITWDKRSLWVQRYKKVLLYILIKVNLFQEKKFQKSLTFTMNSFRSPQIPDGVVKLITCNLLSGQYNWGYSRALEDGFYDIGCGNYIPCAQTVMQCLVDLSGGDQLAALNEYTTYCNAYSGKNISLESALKQLVNGTQYLISNPSSNATNYAPLAFSMKNLEENYNFFHFIFMNFYWAFDCSMLINLTVLAVIILLAIEQKFQFPWLRKIRSRFTSTIANTHHTETKIGGWYVTILPTIGETYILLFLLVICVLSSVVYYPLHESITGEGKIAFLAKCIANRTGGIAFGLLPLTVLLVGRNNMICCLTGMPYCSMIFYHKWAARLMTLYGSVHGVLWIGYLVWNQRGEFMNYSKDTTLILWGFLICIISVILIIKSVYMWKSRHYELFLSLHIILAAVFFYGCYKHSEELGWLGWINLSVALWFMDRILRLFKIFKFGGLKLAYCKVLDPDNEIFQIAIPNTGSLKFFPGCYAFLYVLNTKLFWHSHPFSLMKQGNKIIIVIKAKTGMTKELYNKLPKDGTNYPIRVCLEGPYGHNAPVDCYDHALLITSGTAIAGPISYLQRMQKIDDCHFIWIISNERFLDHMRYALERLMVDNRCSLDIYITRPLGLDISWVPKSTRIHIGRPNIDDVVHEDLSCWKNSAVVSCALPLIDDHVRNSVAREMSLGTVDFYDELQVW